MGQVTAASALVEASILAAEVLEEDEDSVLLVDLAWKVGREATLGELPSLRVIGSSCRRR